MGGWNRNDFFPFDRAELRRFDPGGLRMVEEVWGIGASATAPP